ncbi:histone-like nucleoid-structuring protein, MvaT/MvaU family [Pseudomonas citronellolis]|uniref:histone-like nucleoid-structuring protein, MvaT/MvaU family n=1 Tax=Pseudomonas TaxID=286 RepID=UPI000E2F5389|nr:histone-like nucleoid-structuring protein, MvaT/MvaU family [Pseudomonas citronellolis]MCP1605230.1 DNA-binding protein H-NS [Pseudomonas citronellolis]MCP1656337.1 DNA-binding protein H-NS [Pseudomonas citronellolis]MCP1723210.1 DNA-binding protein H-NS [Pseudomonas citronellolis]
MSKLAEFRAVEKALAEQMAHLESLKNDVNLQKEIEFEQKLNELMQTYGKSLGDVTAILDPRAHGEAPARAGRGVRAKRRARAVKVYRNPHSGEVVETKGGNHKVLKAWKAEYGSDVVDSWLQKK